MGREGGRCGYRGVELSRSFVVARASWSGALLRCAEGVHDVVM